MLVGETRFLGQRWEPSLFIASKQRPECQHVWAGSLNPKARRVAWGSRWQLHMWWVGLQKRTSEFGDPADLGQAVSKLPLCPGVKSFLILWRKGLPANTALRMAGKKCQGFAVLAQPVSLIGKPETQGRPCLPKLPGTSSYRDPPGVPFVSFPACVRRFVSFQMVFHSDCQNLPSPPTAYGVFLASSSPVQPLCWQTLSFVLTAIEG